jgi:hypothetical protein
MGELCLLSLFIHPRKEINTTLNRALLTRLAQILDILALYPIRLSQICEKGLHVFGVDSAAIASNLSLVVTHILLSVALPLRPQSFLM